MCLELVGEKQGALVGQLSFTSHGCFSSYMRSHRLLVTDIRSAFCTVSVDYP